MGSKSVHGRETKSLKNGIPTLCKGLQFNSSASPCHPLKQTNKQKDERGIKANNGRVGHVGYPSKSKGFKDQMSLQYTTPNDPERLGIDHMSHHHQIGIKELNDEISTLQIH